MMIEEKTLDLSSDQQHAQDRVLEALDRDRTASLAGPAGSGKTTLMRSTLTAGLTAGLVKPGAIRLVAPTGKASRRLSQTTRMPASTIHRLIYRGASDIPDADDERNIAFIDAPVSVGRDSLVVVDEASMLGTKLHQALTDWLPEGCRTLFVGDREQLEPVNDRWGVDLANPTAALTQVHRQAAENPIIAMATAIREDRGDEWMRSWNDQDARVALYSGGAGPALDWYLPLRDNADITMITFTHRIRQLANREVRHRLGLSAQGPLVPGDKILIRVNNPELDLVNGDVFRVASVREYRDIPGTLAFRTVERPGQEFVVCADLIDADQNEWWAWKKDMAGAAPWAHRANITHIWYGDCLTVHSSQGSQWADVGFLWCDKFTSMRSFKRTEARRLLYTAVTRASERVRIFAGVS